MIQKQDLRYFQEKQILVASIDIGTNSTHLLVAEINLELKSFSIKFTDKSTTRLGERDEEGNLTEESIQRALVTLKRFKEYCKSNGVKQIVTAATSAVREASLTALVAAVTICFTPLLLQYSLNRLRVTNALWIDSSVRLPSSSLSPRRVVDLSVNFIENDFNSRLISATKRCVELVPISIEATKICFS